MMKVIVDEAICSGHLRCLAMAPEVFTANEEGLGRPIHPEGMVDPQWEDQARAAEANCPERAITIIDD